MGKFFQVLQRAEQTRELQRRITEGSQLRGKQPEGELITAPFAQERVRESENGDARLFGSNEPAAELLKKIDPHLVSLLVPASPEAEQYRALSFNIEQLHKESGLTVLAVSSPNVGDGKTTTAINLAATLAQNPGVKVFLVDMDLRRPAIASALGLRHLQSKGVVGAVLDRSLAVDDLAWKWPSLNLTILPAGRTQGAPHEILKSPRLGELLAEARQQYDYVVLDTPPLAPLPDCKTLGQWVDGFLLVIAAHRTPRKLIEEAMATLEPAKFAGVVFNQEDWTTHKYYYYNAYEAPREKGGRLRQLWRRLSPL